MPTARVLCAAIMSYNFTPGDNPELKSVTTCTPARPNSVYRTDDENRKRPPAPALLMISSPQSVPSAKGKRQLRIQLKKPCSGGAFFVPTLILLIGFTSFGTES